MAKKAKSGNGFKVLLIVMVLLFGFYLYKTEVVSVDKEKAKTEIEKVENAVVKGSSAVKEIKKEWTEEKKVSRN